MPMMLNSGGKGNEIICSIWKLLSAVFKEMGVCRLMRSFELVCIGLMKEFVDPVSIRHLRL